jgi:hypothetical protein
VDCFQKVRQQVKCYLQMATVVDKNELQKVSFTETCETLMSLPLPVLNSLM